MRIREREEMVEELTPEDLPNEVSRGVLKIADGLELEVINLDNGMRLISENSIADYLKWLSNRNPF
jgi:hypothetical protein